MIVNRLLLIVLLLSAQWTYAQENTPAKSRFRLTNIFVSAGNYPGLSENLSLDDFRLLAPGSALLQNDFSYFEQSPASFYDNSYLIRAGLAVSFADVRGKEKRLGHELRLGAVYGGGTLYSGYYWSENRFPVDTFVSLKNGALYVLDSISMRSYLMQYDRKYLGLDASLIFYSPSFRAFSVYAGLGLNANYDYRNSVYIHYTRWSTLEQSGSAENRIWQAWGIRDGDEAIEYLPAAGALSASLFIPLGLDWKFWKSRKGPGSAGLRLSWQ